MLSYDGGIVSNTVPIYSQWAYFYLFSEEYVDFFYEKLVC